MVALLSDIERRSLHHRYRNSELFRQWSAILCQLERDAGEMDAVSLWYLAEKCLNRLRDIQQYRDEEIPYIYNDLISECSVFSKGKGVINRSPEAAERSAVVVMCVMLTSLMNAVEKGHETEDFDNKTMCVAIDRLLYTNLYYAKLMRVFFGRKTGNDGKKVVISPSDPMDNSVILECMDDEAKQDIEAMKTRVMELTKDLKVYFKEKWSAWVSVWDEICKITEFMQLLSALDPKRNAWGLNEKMICNVLGIFLELNKDIELAISTANNSLAPKKNRRDYITSHGRNGGSSAVFSEEQHTRIENIIKNKING